MYTQSIGFSLPHGFRPPGMPHAAPPRPLVQARSGPAHFTPTAAPSHMRFQPSPALTAQILRRNQEAFRQREMQRLMQQNRYTREQALIAANAALAAQNASLAAQAAQQAAAQSTPSMPAVQQPSTPVSPASPAADLTPQQDASDGGEAPAELPHAHKSHLLLFAGIAAAAGVGGYFLLKKKRAAAPTR